MLKLQASSGTTVDLFNDDYDDNLLMSPSRLVPILQYSPQQYLIPKPANYGQYFSNFM